jgi:probable F420-dependent oxidoreductase
MRTVPYATATPPVDPPVVLGSLLPRMIGLAAAETAGVLTYFSPPQKTAEVRTAIGPEKWLCAEQAVLLDTDPVRARTTAREYMSFYLRMPHYRTMLGALGFGHDDFANGGSDRLVDGIVAWGSADQLNARIAAHRAAGATHVCILPLRQDGDRGPDQRALDALAPARSS